MSKAQFFELENVCHRWGWLLLLGIATLALGTSALIAAQAETLETISLLGWLIALSGSVEVVFKIAMAIHAFPARNWNGSIMHLFGGIAGALVGAAIVTRPAVGPAAWTLLLAAFLTITGILRLMAAFKMRFLTWGWTAFDASVTILFGVLLWAHLPWSGLWFHSLAVGISLMLRGWSYVVFSLVVA